ncbi:MAG TPA: TonB-dependent receptor [Magnetospirillaceae bacterium]|jgi:outer membrane receptor protein involved in Fe transport
MSAHRTVSAGRSLTFVSTLLLTTALAAPAFAQVEEVVVTAQKRAEDVQTVPIAISAYSGEDLKAHQIDQFKDLQFNAPNTTYTAGNFGGADFQIRGIGITAVGYDSESGVAINQNDVYLADPQITEGSFYDLADLEVLAGPQTTLYGRGATGGAINVNFAKPDLSAFSASVIGSYANYNAMTATGMVNMPIITDELGIRLAGDWYKRDGFVENIFNNSRVDSRDDYSMRGSLRWQPTNKTTIDITGQFSNENDSHMRSDKQLCTTDPTGVLGCLPTSAGTQPLNAFSTLSTIASSQQTLTSLLGPALGPVLGLYNLASTPTLPPGYIDPAGARQINTDFTPIYNSQDNFMSAEWNQGLTPWLKATLVGGYDHNAYFSEESYNNIPGGPLPSNTAGFPANCGAAVAGSPNLQCAATEFLGTLSALAGPAYAANYAPFFANAFGANPELPISSTKNLGITGGDYTFTPNAEGYDRSDGRSSEYSGEVRFSTSFSGPLNAMIGGYYLHTHVSGDYYVNSDTLDYPGIVLGAFSGLSNPALCFTTGCIEGPSFYHNYGETDQLTSKSVYGELYYDLVPDTFKLTGGLRYTDDQKYQQGRIELYDGLIPIGTTNEAAAETAVRCPTGPTTCAVPLFDTTDQEFTNVSGHITANWTPKTDFTDQTLVYASYSRGYKAGGANPGIEPGFGAGLLVPNTYGPEIINAYEVGTKNQLFGNTLQANADVYYYDYNGLQVSSIEDNTSVNQNIDAKIWGEEGQFLWVPSDRWQFGFNIAAEQMDVQGQEVDPRNPTGGDPHTLLVKDDTLSADTGSNCVLYYTGAFPGLPAGYTAPAAGIHSLASQGVANVAFGSCAITAAQAKTAGYSLVDPSNPNNTLGGVLTNLNGNELQNTPSLSLSLSGQYTQPLSRDYNLIFRADYHWQSHMWGRIFEDGADYIKSGDVMNLSLQLNSLNDNWYAQGFVKNVFNKNNITGEYLTSATSGLYTNAFYGDPRMYGIEVGVKF